MRIRDRPKAGAWLGFALSVLFAGVMVPLTTFDLWAGDAVDAAGRAVFTLRLPETSLWHDTLIGPRLEHRRIVVARGAKVDPADKRLVEAYEDGRRPPSVGLLLGLGIAYFMLGMLLTSYLRKFGYRGRRLRTQLTMLGCLVAAALLYKAYLLLTPFSPYWLPIGAFSIAVAVHHDRQVAFAGTVALSFLVGSLIPFDLGLAMVLLLQGFGAIMFLTRPRKWWGLVGRASAAACSPRLGYLALYFLVRGRLPDEDTTSMVSSGLVGAIGGGLASGDRGPDGRPAARARARRGAARQARRADRPQPAAAQAHRRERAGHVGALAGDGQHGRAGGDGDRRQRAARPRRRLLPRPRQVVGAAVLHREPARGRAVAARLARAGRLGRRDLRALHRGRAPRARGGHPRAGPRLHAHAPRQRAARVLLAQERAAGESQAARRRRRSAIRGCRRRRTRPRSWRSATRSRRRRARSRPRRSAI